MSLADRIAEQNVGVRRGPSCHVSHLLDQLPDRDRDDVLEALDNGTVTTTAIFRALRNDGHATSLSSLARHRRGDCRCGA